MSMYKAPFEPEHIFTDNMVLQRDACIPVWGAAEDGSTVTVELCGVSRAAKAVGGKWSVTLPPLQAGGPYEMLLKNGSTVITLANILVGEVWLAGGQSNMEQPLLLTKHGREEIPEANYPEIRYYNVPRRPFENALIDGWHFVHTFSSDTSWEVCTPESAGLFSAAAFHFAKELQAALNIPVGIVGCNWGGTSASCWLDEKCLSGDEKLKVYLDEYEEQYSSLGADKYEELFEHYLGEIKRFSRDMEKVPINPDNVEEYMLNDSAYPFPWPPMGPKTFLRPSGLYRTMLKKVVPYAIRGVIWYQGESDVSKPHLYRRLFGRMMQNWREDWDNPELPFLFVQLSSYGGEDPGGEAWAKLREAQRLTAEGESNCAMVVSVDWGDKINIHPVNKRPVGQRLALAARGSVYGGDVVYSGPAYREMRVTGNKACLYFDHVGKGLMAGGGDLRGFKICGGDRRFYDAEAKINGNCVEVYSGMVGSPAAIRYGWANYTDVNLYNSEGLPASPFSTDKEV